MKKINLGHTCLAQSFSFPTTLFFLGLNLLSPQLSSAQTTTPSKDLISTVTILSDRAEVTRQQKVNCVAKQGLRVSFKALPKQVQVKTLRASVKGSAKVIGVTYRSEKHTDHKKLKLNDAVKDTKAYQEWEKRYQDLVKKQQVLMAEKTRLEQSQSLTTKEKQRLKIAVANGLHTGQLDFKTLTKSLERLVRQERQMAKRLVDIDEEIYALKMDLYQLSQTKPLANNGLSPQQSSTHGLHGGSAIVSMTCLKSGPLSVELSYITAGASWRFDYALNIKSKSTSKASLSWSVNAIVRQTTGEDWRNAQIYLSTAQPNLGDQAPRPRPLHITGSKYTRQKVLTQRSEDRQDLASGQAQAPSEPSSVGIEDRGQSFGLKVPQKSTILSNGQAYWIPVSENRSSKAKFALVTTPKLSPAVYQVIRFHNPATHPLPAGTLALNLDGQFLGQIKTQHYGTGEAIEFTLGIEETLGVQRTLKDGKDKKAGLLENDQSLLRRFEIKVSNRSKKRRKIEVVDNIPVSEIEDVKVILNKKQSTKGYKLNTKTGFITWKITLKPKENKSLSLAYKVELPDDWKLR